jgi:hypothetical protein
LPPGYPGLHFKLCVLIGRYKMLGELLIGTSLSTASFFLKVVGKVAEEEGVPYVANFFEAQSVGLEAFEKSLSGVMKNEDPVVVVGAFTAGLIALAVLGPAIASTGAIATLGASLAPVFGETVAASLASGIVETLITAGGGSLYTGLQQTLQSTITALSGAIVSAPTSTVTANQTSSGGNLILFPAGGALPQIVSFSAAAPTVDISANGTTALSIVPGLWSSLSSNGQQYSINSTQLATGALTSTTNTYSLSGNLTQISQNFSNGNIITFDSGTISTSSFDPATNLLSATLTTPLGQDLANLSYNSLTGTGAVTLTNGLTINVPGGLNLHIHDPAETPLSVLESYLSDLGDSLTAAQLDQLNFNYLNPAGTAYTVAGTVSPVYGTSGTITSAGVTYIAGSDWWENNAPGAVVAGQSTAEVTEYVNGNPTQVSVPAYNILDAAGDISTDSVSNIQELSAAGDVTLTNAQFNSFSAITGSGTITAADGGTWNLAQSSVQGTFNLTASDMIGTTLSGNATDYQTLTASPYGNDTLQAGNGAGDMLVAGGGVDTLIGGTGGDYFEATTGLAQGSVIQGNGSGNTLIAGMDISGVTISGIQTLQIVSDSEANWITLDASELSGFSSIDGGATIYAASGGAYDISGKTNGSDSFDLTALSDDGATLIGDDGSLETLTPSASGNDTLIAGDGDGDILDASNAYGNDTLRAGNGAGDWLYAGYGADTLIGGTGGDTFWAANGLAPGSSIQGNGTGNTLFVNGDISGATVTGVQTLETVGSVTLTAQELSGFSAIDGSGVIYAATGGTYDIAGKTDDTGAYELIAVSDQGTTLIGDNSPDEILQASAAGNDTLQAGNGAGDLLTAGGGAGILIAGTGGDTLTGGSGNDTFVLSATGNNTVLSGSGANEAVFSGSRAGYAVVDAGTTTTVTNRATGAVDTLTGVQTLQFADVTVPSYTPADNFTGEPTSDILGWNPTTGVIGDFVMTNGVASQFQEAAWVNPSSGYHVVGAGDFYGTGTADILLANSSGQIGEFEMSNNAATWQGIGLINSGAGWAVAGTGDFYGNGTDDILLANQSAGQIGEFKMTDGVATWQGIGTVNAASGWAVAGTGDFFGNGTDDILLTNQSAGQIGMFEMNNGVASWQGIGTVNAAAGWAVAGTGDFFGNGTDDILLANSQTGQLGMFAMNNGAASWQSIGTVGAGWQVAGTGDYFGNGTSDVLLQNASTGGIGMFAMNNGVASWQGISSLPTGWHVS